MDKGPRAELLGSNDAEVPLGRQPARSRLKLANRPFTTFSESFNPSAMRADTPGEPDRVFLTLENIRGKEGSGIFDVILHKPDAPPGSPGTKAGSISLFGLENASRPNGDHGGAGLTKTLEITKAVDAMKLDQTQAGTLDVEIIPRSDVRDEDDIKIGQISVHRQSGQ